MTVVADISSIEMLPVTETTAPQLQGFFLRAYKRQKRKKIGFLLNAIRAVRIEQPGPNRIRTQITWLQGKNAFEVEEQSSRAGQRGRTTILFQIRCEENFSKDPIYLQGKPNITKNKFQCKSIEIIWGIEGLISLKSIEKKDLICNLKKKQKTIDILIEN